MRNTSLRPFLLVLITLCVLPIFAFGQTDEGSKPDLNQTVQYLTERINDIPMMYQDVGYGRIQTLWKARSALGGILITHKDMYASGSTLGKGTFMDYTIDFSGLDPKKVKHGRIPNRQGACVVIEQSDPKGGAIRVRKYSVKKEGGDYQEQQTLTTNNESFLTIDGLSDDDARKVANSFIHAIQLSGGKPARKDPFDY